MLKSLFEDPAIAAIFSDDRSLAEMVSVEVALARVESSLGIIPPDSAKAIIEKSATFQPDANLIRSKLTTDGIPVIELVRQLRDHVSGDAANNVHFGATTQDIMDTALALQMRAALDEIENLLWVTITNLASMAGDHRDSIMPGRTHSQQAVPIPFGFKVAGWIAPLLRHRERLVELRPRLLVIQLGGAAGTFAPLGTRGVEVAEALAAELKLSVPLIPWHTGRDTLAEVANWLSMLTGSLGKIAQDIILMAQTEIGEVRESNESGRGGSSTMPQKSNPISSEHIIAIARTNAALLNAMHNALIQEHERATSGWQIEWLTLPQMFELTAVSLRKADFLSANLSIDEARMRHNVAASNGLMMAEAVTFALSEHMSRKEAKALVTAACQTAVEENRNMVDIVKEQSGAPLDWDALKDESKHLGSAQEFITRVLRAVQVELDGVLFEPRTPDSNT